MEEAQFRQHVLNTHKYAFWQLHGASCFTKHLVLPREGKGVIQTALKCSSTFADAQPASEHTDRSGTGATWLSPEGRARPGVPAAGPGMETMARTVRPTCLELRHQVAWHQVAWPWQPRALGGPTYLGSCGSDSARGSPGTKAGCSCR